MTEWLKVSETEYMGSLSFSLIIGVMCMLCQQNPTFLLVVLMGMSVCASHHRQCKNCYVERVGKCFVDLLNMFLKRICPRSVLLSYFEFVFECVNIAHSVWN